MIFKCDCPHCGARSVAFTHHKALASQRSGRTDVFASCGHCERGIVAMVRGRPVSTAEDMYRFGWTTAPDLPDTGAPVHTPGNVGRFFEQGLENLPRNFDAAGTMFRKALDTALTARFSELEGSLMKRIDKAADNGALTPDMAQWAHRIRHLGNDAAHDEEPFSPEDAQELHGFTDLVLRYLFSLPGMLAAAQGGGGADEAGG